ncbi:MAG: transposase [Luteolibacter sp.]
MKLSEPSSVLTGLTCTIQAIHYVPQDMGLTYQNAPGLGTVPPRGKRPHASAPCGRWKTTTMIGTVRQDERTACMTVEGALNAETFRTCIREILLPVAQAGDILIMDNLLIFVKIE